MSRSRVVSKGQMKKLLDLLSEKGILVNGTVSYSGTTKPMFWKRIAMRLNEVEGGVSKNTWQWCRMWQDWKNKTKRKASVLKQKKLSKVQSMSLLTNLEARLLKMIGYDWDEDQTDIKMVNKVKVEVPETTPDGLSFLVGAYDSNRDQGSDEEDHAAYQDYTSKAFKKPNNMSVEEFRFRTTMEIEKEKLQHKNEELRLQSLELKLRGDELRQKEIEMEKINHLTTIEEEKLKCFKDISASLKELLEHAKNGNTSSRYLNVL